MDGLLERLKMQNAKERFWLLNSALSGPALSPTFAGDLSSAVGWEVPPSAWWAMDYHLDWLACALYGHGNVGQVQDVPVPTWVLGSQEDVDLIIGWRHRTETRLVLLEAKGVTSHSNKQVASKLDKLSSLFGTGGDDINGVEMRFVLASPSPPQKLVASGVPSWALHREEIFRWMKLPVPTDLVAPVRCDDDGAVGLHGTRWKLRHRYPSHAKNH